MALKLIDLLTGIQGLTPAERQRLLEAVYPTGAVVERPATGVRESAPYHYGSSPQFDAMTLVTVVLPDDLAQQAQDAGLLGGKAMEEILRRALQAHSSEDQLPNQERRLILKNGYLVAEALPGEKPITTEEVKKALDDMEW